MAEVAAHSGLSRTESACLSTKKFVVMKLTALKRHLVAEEGVAISLSAATMVLLLPSSALIACISPSSLAMPCSTCPWTVKSYLTRML